MTRVKLHGTAEINAFVREHGGIRSLDETEEGDVTGDIGSMTLSDGARLIVRLDGIRCGGGEDSSWADEVEIAWYGLIP